MAITAKHGDLTDSHSLVSQRQAFHSLQRTRNGSHSGESNIIGVLMHELETALSA